MQHVEDLKNSMANKGIYKSTILWCYTDDAIACREVDISGCINSWWWQRLGMPAVNIDTLTTLSLVENRWRPYSSGHEHI